jgi:peptide/nickel transport system substrate-binding protein
MGIVDWGARGVPSQAILPAYTSQGIWNSAHWRNPEFDSLFTQLNSTLDETARRRTAAQMAAIQNDQLPSIISYWMSPLRVTSTAVNGLAPGPANHFDPRTLWLAA